MNDNKNISVCPLCGVSYSAAPALSRADNKTQICPDCGIRQALQAVDMSKEEQEQIIDAIHQYA